MFALIILSSLHFLVLFQSCHFIISSHSSVAHQVHHDLFPNSLFSLQWATCAPSLVAVRGGRSTIRTVSWTICAHWLGLVLHMQLRCMTNHIQTLAQKSRALFWKRLSRRILWISNPGQTSKSKLCCQIHPLLVLLIFLVNSFATSMDLTKRNA